MRRIGRLSAFGAVIFVVILGIALRQGLYAQIVTDPSSCAAKGGNVSGHVSGQSDGEIRGNTSGKVSGHTGRQTLLDVPFIDQRGRYPTGCESVSAVMALRYAGIDITVDDFIQNHLPQTGLPHPEGDALVGGSPWQAFIGSPYERSGFGCYAPVIAKAIKSAIESIPAASGYDVHAVYRQSIEQLCKTYIDRGVPVIFWATQRMAKPHSGKGWRLEGSGESFQWIAPMHCLVLVGYSGDTLYFHDPLAGANVPYPKAAVEAAYRGLHSQAVVIERR